MYSVLLYVPAFSLPFKYISSFPNTGIRRYGTISFLTRLRDLWTACERLILLETDSKELRDYSVLLYHAGFYEESLQYLKLYLDSEVNFFNVATQNICLKCTEFKMDRIHG